jgi:hypothetical protein
MSKYIHIAQIDVPAEHEAEFNRLYDEEHVPRITSVPGVLSGRRFKLNGGARGEIPRYLAIYELESTMTARMGGTFEAME